MENTIEFYSKNETVSGSLERLQAMMEEGGSFLEMSVKDIHPCLNSLLSEAGNQQGNSQLVVGDLVARLSSAEKQLSEALCLVRDALTSVSTGTKFYKDSVVKKVEEAV